jgi:hypothetical protein
MYRIFKKKHDLAAKNTEARARRKRRQRLGLEALEGRQLLSLSPVAFTVNTQTAGNQFESDTASSAAGSVVVWTTNGIGGGSTHDIHAQMFNPNGTKRGFEFLVNEARVENRLPKVAMNNQGEFVVAWERSITFVDGTVANNTSTIESRFFDSAGHPTEQHDQVASDFLAVGDRQPAVAIDLFGNYVISYTEGTLTTDRNVRAKEFDRNHTLLSDIHVGASSIADETRSSVAIPSNNTGFDIAYQFETHGSSQSAVILNEYGGNGQLKPNGVHVISNSTDSRDPSVAMDNAGNAVVAYSRLVGTDYDIKAKRLNSSGAVGSEIFVQQTFAQETDPDVAVSPTGGAFVVAYDTDLFGAPPGTNRSVEVSEVNASDTVVGRLNLPAFPNNADPALSINNSGGYQLTYTSGVGGDQNISLQFGQLPVAPAAQNLALTPMIKAGQSATLTGQLFDGNGDTNLTLSVNWGDGSLLQQSKPGTKPFAVTHKYVKPGTYTVRATWTDSTGLSNSRDLTITVK